MSNELAMLLSAVLGGGLVKLIEVLGAGRLAQSQTDSQRIDKLWERVDKQDALIANMERRQVRMVSLMRRLIEELHRYVPDWKPEGDLEQDLAEFL